MATKQVNIDIIAKDKTRQAMNSATKGVDKVKNAVFNLRNAFIGLGAVVTKSVPDYALMLGVPATQTGWMSEYGERMIFSDNKDNIFICKYSGDSYILEGHLCRKI